jgi:hypothetical protein
VTRKKTRLKACVFDIETIADPEMAKLLPPVKVAGNLKDPEKIKIDIEEKEKKRRNEMGLHPLQKLEHGTKRRNCCVRHFPCGKHRQVMESGGLSFVSI